MLNNSRKEKNVPHSLKKKKLSSFIFVKIKEQSCQHFESFRNIVHLSKFRLILSIIMKIFFNSRTIVKYAAEGFRMLTIMLAIDCKVAEVLHVTKNSNLVKSCI